MRIRKLAKAVLADAKTVLRIETILIQFEKVARMRRIFAFLFRALKTVFPRKRIFFWLSLKVGMAQAITEGVQITITDAGRTEPHPTERRDCTVRAHCPKGGESSKKT